MEDERGVRSIEPNPLNPDPAEAWVLPRCVPVWVIIGQLKLDYWNTELVAMQYELSPEAVREAVRYYQGYQEAIDTRLAANRSFFRV